MKKKIFIIAGEKSGDLLGAKILKNLDKNEFEFAGVGDDCMKKEGLDSIFPINDLSLMGIFEIIPKIFTILKRIKQTVKAIIDFKPDIVLTIDSPDFNFRVIKKIKKIDRENKIKTIHFIAPSVWVYRKNRAEKISKMYNLLLCILPFEPPYFEKYGLKTVFVGHPIFYKDSHEYEFNNKNVFYYDDSKEITITLGSRIGEIKRFIPIIFDVIRKLQENHNFKYNFLATKDTHLFLKKLIIENENFKIILDENEKIKAIKRALVALTKSGTNTLEFSAFKIPIIVFYKFNFLTNIIAKFIQKTGKIKFANLLNILSNKEIIPECILGNCNSKIIFDKTVDLIDNKNKRIQQINDTQNELVKLGFNKDYSIKLIIDEINNIYEKY